MQKRHIKEPYQWKSRNRHLSATNAPTASYNVILGGTW
jgi:hypothetical protein